MKKNILDVDQTYYDEYDSFCYQNCLRQILEFQGVEDAFFFINMSLSFKLRREEAVTYRVGEDEGARSLLPRFSSKVRRFHYDGESAEEIWEMNRKTVEGGTPIITGVDSFHLSYLPHYQTNHARHTVILGGYEPKGDLVHIVDWFSPWFFKGGIAREGFLVARNSENAYDGGIYSGSPIRNNWAELDGDGWGEEGVSLIRDNLLLTRRQFYERHEGMELNGIYAIEELVDVMEQLKMEPMEDHSIVFKKMHYDLYNVNRRRDFFKLFLTAANQKTRNEAFGKAAERLTALYDDWEKLLFQMIKYCYRRKEDGLNRLMAGFGDVMVKEWRFKEDLDELVECLLF